MDEDKKERRRTVAVVWAAYFLFSLFMLVGTRLTELLLPANHWKIGLGIGFVLTLATIPLTVIASKHIESPKPHRLLCTLVIIFNGFSTGCSAGTYFSAKSKMLTVKDALIATAIFLLLSAAIGLLMAAPSAETIIKLCVIFLGLGFLIAAIILFIRQKEPIYAYLFFLSLIFLIVLLISYFATREPFNRLLYPTVGSYGFYMLVTVAVLLLLSGGDCCDGCDCGDCNDGKSRKEKRSK